MKKVTIEKIQVCVSSLNNLMKITLQCMTFTEHISVIVVKNPDYPIFEVSISLHSDTAHFQIVRIFPREHLSLTK